MGPRNSDILVYGYGPYFGLINHSRDKVNLALRWSTKAFHKSKLLTLPKEQFWQKIRPGDLVMELYALRNIEPGEELFLDYGDEWEEAWNEHVRNWQPPEGA